MSSFDSNKNIMVKKLLNKRFGLFKSAVLRAIQFSLFKKQCTAYIKVVQTLYRKEEKIIIVKSLFNFLCTNTDNWKHNIKLSTTIKGRLLEFRETSTLFDKYLIEFGWMCIYPNCKGEQCGLIVTNRLCEIHAMCWCTDKDTVKSSLPCINDDVCSIIYQYIM